MTTIDRTDTIEATPDKIFQALTSPEFFDGLLEHLHKISEVEVIEMESLGAGRFRRVVRYTAPTQLPRFLKRFADKAPDQVHWDEIADVDTEGHRISFEIIPEMPEHWHERYESQGRLEATDRGSGSSELTQSVTYSIDAPRGFGMLINRSLKSEIADIFEAQAEHLKSFLR